MDVTEIEVPFRDWTTWARVTEPEVPVPGALPVVLLHGGPGMAHDYLRNLAALVEDGAPGDPLRPARLRPQHAPADAPREFWTPELFVEEFENLVRTSGSSGTTWPGSRGAGCSAREIAVRRPAGLASLGILNSPASMELWVAGANRLRDELPAETREALERHEADGSIEDPEYLAAVDVYYRRHVCRMDPYPADFIDSVAQMEAEPTVYHTMNGVNEFFVTGTMAGWTVIDRLPQVAVPTLVLAGEFDEATPEVWQPFVDLIPDVRSHVEPDASHCSHLEHPQAILELLAAFLAEND